MGGLPQARFWPSIATFLTDVQNTMTFDPPTQGPWQQPRKDQAQPANTGRFHTLAGLIEIFLARWLNSRRWVDWGANIDARDVCSLPGESDRRGPPDSTGCPGNDRDFSLQTGLFVLKFEGS